MQFSHIKTITYLLSNSNILCISGPILARNTVSFLSTEFSQALLQYNNWMQCIMHPCCMHQRICKSEESNCSNQYTPRLRKTSASRGNLHTRDFLLIFSRGCNYYRCNIIWLSILYGCKFYMAVNTIWL